MVVHTLVNYQITLKAIVLLQFTFADFWLSNLVASEPEPVNGSYFYSWLHLQ